MSIIRKFFAKFCLPVLGYETISATISFYMTVEVIRRDNPSYPTLPLAAVSI